MQRVLLLILISIGLGLIAGPLSAEIFKYVDADGKIHFTDDPPAGTAAEMIQLQPTNILGSEGTQKPVSRSPGRTSREDLISTRGFPKVELFVTSWCGYCKKAEAYLREKGVPFTVYDIEKDLQAARRKDSLTTRKGVPFALIGDQMLTGFSEMSYARALKKTE